MGVIPASQTMGHGERDRDYRRLGIRVENGQGGASGRAAIRVHAVSRSVACVDCVDRERCCRRHVDLTTHSTQRICALCQGTGADAVGIGWAAGGSNRYRSHGIRFGPRVGIGHRDGERRRCASRSAGGERAEAGRRRPCCHGQSLSSAGAGSVS